MEAILKATEELRPHSTEGAPKNKWPKTSQNTANKKKTIIINKTKRSKGTHKKHAHKRRIGHLLPTTHYFNLVTSSNKMIKQKMIKIKTIKRSYNKNQAKFNKTFAQEI